VRIYLDSSALVKRGLLEDESSELGNWLASRVADGDILLSSALSWVEVSRAIRTRLDDASPTEVVDLIEVALSGLLEVPMGEQVVSLARRLGPTGLRSLDAIHLASATLVGADLLCAYDARLLVSAAELGFATHSPA